jgi:hypothetical protein
MYLSSADVDQFLFSSAKQFLLGRIYEGQSQRGLISMMYKATITPYLRELNKMTELPPM